MIIDTRRSEETTILDLNTERATIDVVEELRNFFNDSLQNDLVQNYVINFEKVEFIDSTFLGACVTALKRIKPGEGDIRMLNVQPGVKAILQLTRLDRVFGIFENEEEAVGSFRELN